jgi:cytosine/adenosine deaminase-related metal-dependent hydrolase
VEEFRHRLERRPNEAWTVRARWIVPVDRPPLRDGWITILADRIVAIGSGRPESDAVDLGEALMLPGLVNAHTHLEFSDLQAPLGSPGQPMPDWIRAVLAWRRSAPPRGPAIAAGLSESAVGGVTLLADIVQPTERDSLRIAPPLTLVGLLELLGLGEERCRQLETLAAEYLADANLPTEVLSGLSPHAPYSTHPELVAAAVRLANNRPVAMHLAESREELELLATGGGPFRSLLEDLGVWAPQVFTGGRRILDYLQMLAAAPRSLVIHGNYLSEAEVAYAAQQAEQMSVVYCPRTHEYFGHEPYPLARLLNSGVSLAVGTDSRASNPNLNLVAELRAIHRLHPQVAPAKIVELGTLSGARALGMDAEHGSLTPGKLANLVIMPLESGPDDDPAEHLLTGTTTPQAVVYRGKRVELPGLADR